MSESQHDCPHSRHALSNLRMSRRRFLKNVAVFSAAALTGTGLLEGCSPSAPAETAAPPAPTLAPPTAVPPLGVSTATPLVRSTAAASAPQSPTPVPDMGSTGALLDAIKNRKSTNAFRSQPLPQEKLLELLWAAWGINRPESGKRTAPSAMNTQEIDLYVLLPEGAYVYDAQQNWLTFVSNQDLRAKTGGTQFRDAPVHLLFVADYARYRTGTQVQKELWSSAHTGFIGQNVYLYCASEGLGAHFYVASNDAGLRDGLKLRTTQAILFGQAVGYPNE